MESLSQRIGTCSICKKHGDLEYTDSISDTSGTINSSAKKASGHDCQDPGRHGTGGEFSGRLRRIDIDKTISYRSS